MFNLEEQIQSWRQSISIILGDRPELLDELENHLRDDFKRSLIGGKSDVDGWELALRNLGDPKQLAGEFGKVEAARWMPANIAEIMVAIGVVALIWRVLHSMSAGKIGPLLAWHIVVVTIAYWAMLTIGFLAIWAVILHAVSGLQDRQINAMRAVVTRLSWVSVAGMALGIVLGGFWAQDHLGRWWGWDATEIGALGVLAWGCLMLRWSASASMARMLPPMAIMGNIVVCLSWLGPVLMNGRHPENGNLGMYLGLFLIIQFLAIYLSTLPAGSLRIAGNSAPSEH